MPILVDLLTVPRAGPPEPNERELEVGGEEELGDGAPFRRAAAPPSVREGLVGGLRRVPESLAELERSLPPVTVYVTGYGPKEAWLCYSASPWIKLNDIVVAEPLRGLGFGSAALAELCGYADHHGVPIQGDLQPGAGRPEEAVMALAYWYHKRGFRQGNLDPAQWLRLGPIRREPVSSDIAPCAERGET